VIEMMQAVGVWLAVVLVALGAMRLNLAVVVRDRQSPERQTICPTLSLTPSSMLWSQFSALVVTTDALEPIPNARTMTWLIIRWSY
jgi:hypothetical protein